MGQLRFSGVAAYSGWQMLRRRKNAAGPQASNLLWANVLIMAGDLAGTPDSGVTVQLCGDAHLSNFGLFGTPERRLLFDINDFDETLPGPWEWDVKRLAASFEVAGRDRGFSKSDRREIVMAGVREYVLRMGESAAMRRSTPGTSTTRRGSYWRT